MYNLSFDTIRLKGIDKDIRLVSFASKKLVGKGFKSNYTLEDRVRAAIDKCREKGQSDKSTQTHENGKVKEIIPVAAKDIANDQATVPLHLFRE